jgi:prevent-host-death family protein
MKIGAGEFKAKCLQIMDDVHKTKEEVIVTKHGKAVVKVIPVFDEKTRPLFGFLKDSVSIHSDIVTSSEIPGDGNE